MQRRIRLLEAVVLLAAFCVEGRLVYLQVIKHAEFHELAYRQQYTPRETRPSRGVIEARDGSLLAMNIGLFNVAAHPDQIADKPAAAATLSKALGLPYASVYAKLESRKPFVWIEREVPYQRSEAVDELSLEGVDATREQHRFYPDHEMAAQILGFTGIDNQGLDGLEKYYNRALAGKRGLVLAERDARGRMVMADNKPIKAGVEGLDIVTTLDKTLQHITQVELQKAYEKFHCHAATAIVMDPHTGEILALANYPTFDPNHYADFPVADWKDRAVNDEFEPGSTFKLVAAVGALEEGVVNEDDKFFCEDGAYHTKYGRVVRDHEKFGWLTFREIFGYSSNIGMVKVAEKLGVKNLYRYCRKFGFGVTTGIDLPGEADGKLRPLDEWSGLSVTTIPYGYEVSATPLQIADAYAAIANDGVMMQPHIVKRLEDSDGTTIKAFGPKVMRRVCSRRTAHRITEMLKWVVQNGTGKAVSLAAYPIAGKTGTAYKFIHGRYSKYEYFSSFVGFVPAENPKFLIYVSMDDPRGIYWGGWTAGPVVKEVAKRALVYAMVPPVNQDSALASGPDRRSVPSFKGLTEDQCRWLAQIDGVKLKFAGDGPRVVDQSEKPGSPVEGKDHGPVKVVLTLGQSRETADGKGVMPDLRGKTKRQALALLSPLGVSVNFKGEGIVKTQYPPAGRALSSGTPCELNCDMPLTKASEPPEGGNS